jgi:hypothetical protein
MVSRNVLLFLRGGGALVAGGGFAFAMPASVPAYAQSAGGPPWYEYSLAPCGIGNCYSFLENLNNNGNNAPVYFGGASSSNYGDQCNVALYSGENVDVGHAIATTPLANCGTFYEDTQGPKGASGEVFTSALWDNTQGYVMDTATAVFPFIDDVQPVPPLELP